MKLRNIFLFITLMATITTISIMGATPSLAQDAAADPNVKRGKMMFLRCRACHSVEQGGAHKVGPNLFGVIGSKIATKEGFKYSDTMESADIVWTEETIEEFIAKPTDYLPRTKMAFVGLPKERDRKALVAYLQSLK